jgi:WD40 repeat protein
LRNGPLRCGQPAENCRLAEVVSAAAIEPYSEAGVRRAAFACADGRVLLAELPALAKVEVVATHTAAARSLSFSPDGAVLATGGRDGVVVLSRLRGEGERTKALPEHTAGVECVSFSPDGSRLASGSRDGRVRLHGGDGRYLRAFEPLRGEILSLAWSEDGSAVAAGTSRGEVHALPVDPERAPRLLAAHPFRVSALLELSGGELAAGGVGKVVRMKWGD